MVGVIIGRVLLGILLFFVLLALCPVTLGVRCENSELRAWVRVLFVKLQLWPMKEPGPKRAAKQKKPKKPAGEKPARKPRKPRTVDYWLRFAERAAHAAGRAMRIILKGLRVRGVELVIPVAGAEAADTAQRYGKTQAAVGGARAALESVLNIRFKRLAVIPDFGGQYAGSTLFAMRATAPVFIFIAAGVVGLWKFFTFKRAFWRRTTPLHRFGAAKAAEAAAVEPPPSAV